MNLNHQPKINQDTNQENLKHLAFVDDLFTFCEIRTWRVPTTMEPNQVTCSDCKENYRDSRRIN